MAGIDFGSQTIKAVTINGRPGRCTSVSVAEIPMPRGTLVDYQLQDIERVSQSLKSLQAARARDYQNVAYDGRDRFQTSSPRSFRSIPTSTRASWRTRFTWRLSSSSLSP